MMRRKRWILAFCTLLGGALLVCSPLLAWLASGTLEWWYTDAMIPENNAGAIVVLSGPGTEARYEHAAWLHRHWRALPVLACAGRGESPEGLAHCEQRTRGMLQRYGVPSSMIWIDQRSASTYEDAVYAADLLRRKHIGTVVLVTQASHMLRAEKCFRSQGLQVIPAPCRFRATRFPTALAELTPRLEYVQESRSAVREWLGIAWYWTKGYF